MSGGMSEHIGAAGTEYDPRMGVRHRTDGYAEHDGHPGETCAALYPRSTETCHECGRTLPVGMTLHISPETLHACLGGMDRQAASAFSDSEIEKMWRVWKTARRILHATDQGARDEAAEQLRALLDLVTPELSVRVGS